MSDELLLRAGDRDPIVARVKRKLNLPVQDDVFTDVLEHRVRGFQFANQLPTHGWLDAPTLQALGVGL